MYQTSSPYIARVLAQYRQDDLERSAARERIAKDSRPAGRIANIIPFRQRRVRTQLAGPITLRGA